MVAITHLTVATLAASAYASPFSTSCRQYTTQLTTLKEEFPQAQHFCESYLASKATTSPVKGLSASVLKKACQCATQDRASAKVLAATPRGNAAGMAGGPGAAVCKNPQLAKLLSGIKNVQYFCQNFNPSQWGNRSPIFGASGSSIQQACQCILNAATASITTSTPAATTSPVSQTSSAATQAPPGLPFRFCPSKSSQLAPFKRFCNTPLWKYWACSCSTAANVCFPNAQLTWCKKPSSSAPAPTASSTSTIPSSSVPTPDTTTPAPVDPTTTPAPTSTTDAPVDTPTTTDAPVVSSSSSVDGGADSTTTTDAPVET